MLFPNVDNNNNNDNNNNHHHNKVIFVEQEKQKGDCDGAHKLSGVHVINNLT